VGAVVTTLAALLVVAWLPGSVVFRLPVADRDRRAALPAEERIFWELILSIAISLFAVLALAAVHRYSFERLLICDAGLAVALAAAARFRLRLGTVAPRPTLWALVPFVLIAVGVWRFFPTSEYVIGGKDPGVYINEGIQIAQKGSLVVRDRDVADVPPFARDLFFPSHQNPTYYSIRFMGFFIQVPDTGAVVGQFPHLYPASIAIAHGLDGLSGARGAVGVWAILGLLALYFAGARLVGRAVAGAAALLLALSVIDVWFARYPNAEMVMQALLIAALLANARAHVDGDRFFAPVAGMLLGLLLFLRFDAVIGVACVLAALALGVVVGRGPRWTFFPPLVVAAALCVWYLGGPMRAYAALPFGYLANLALWQKTGLIGAVLFGVVLPTAATRSAVLRRWVTTWTPILLAVCVVGLAIYAFAFRRPSGSLATFDAYALRTFASFYLTVPGLVAALIGYVLVVRGYFWRDPAFILTVTAFSLFFFYKTRIVPDHFWMTRRFLPIILPGMLLMASAAALVGVRGRGLMTKAVRGPIGVVFLVLLAASYARAARPIMPHVEYAGVIPKLEQLASLVGDDDLLIVESRNSSDAHVLALPLAYIYARHVLVLASPVPDKTVFAAFLDHVGRRYRRVLFMGGGGTDLLSPKWSVSPEQSDHFHIPEYDAPFDAYPRFVRQKEFDYTIYAFGPPSHDDKPVDLDVGVNDDLNVLRFHAKELTEGRTFRWSRDRSYLTLIGLRPDSHTITIWMSNGGRPPAAPPADVTLLVGTRTLGTAHVLNGFGPYEFALPSDVVANASASGEPLRLQLTTTVWNPEQTLGTPDDRYLGVMVDRVAVR
jgi:hypothetical protein